jgi:hypothetical protein
MGKRRASIIFLLSLACHIYAFEHKYGSSDLGLGNLGFYFSSEDEGINAFGNVFNFTTRFIGGIGMTISPLNFFIYNSDAHFLATFINASVFYNFFRDEHFILGPFGSINAINNSFPDFFELHTGITFLMRNFFDYDYYKNSIFGFTFLAVEVGYRHNNRDASGFYASISMDLISMLFGLAGDKKDEAEKYQKEHPLY